MRSPSVKKLVAAFRDLDARGARQIKKIASDAGSGFRSVSEALEKINIILEMHGVEGMGPVDRYDYAPAYEYLNAGDTYATTLIYKRATDRLFIGTYGDVVEREDKDGTW